MPVSPDEFSRLVDLGLPETRMLGQEALQDDELLRQFGGGRLWDWLSAGDGLAEVAQSMKPRRDYAGAAQVGAFEYLRRVAAYVDENPNLPDYLQEPVRLSAFGESWANEAMDIIADASAALDDPPAFAVACSVDARLRHRSGRKGQTH